MKFKSCRRPNPYRCVELSTRTSTMAVLGRMCDCVLGIRHQLSKDAIGPYMNSQFDVDFDA
jgi:hypothetical protein